MKSLRDYLDILTQLDERVTPDGKGGFTGGLTPQPAAPAAAPAAAAPAATTPGQVTSGTGVPVTSGTGVPVTSGTAPAPAAPAAGTNPWEGKDPAKAAAWGKLSPQDQKWLGGADPTDNIILMRAPNKGKPGAAPAAPAAPAATPSAPTTTAADQEDADMGKAMAANAQAATQAANGVNAAGQNVTMPDGTNPETGEKTTVAAAPGAEAGAKPTAPASRDAMPFGKAFADAKAKGEKTFMWKGKSYAVQMAAPKQGAKPAAPAPGFTTGIAPKVELPGASPTQNDALSMMAAGNMGAESINRDNSNILETTGYDEVQRLISLVHHR